MHPKNQFKNLYYIFSAHGVNVIDPKSIKPRLHLFTHATNTWKILSNEFSNINFLGFNVVSCYALRCMKSLRLKLKLKAREDNAETYSYFTWNWFFQGVKVKVSFTFGPFYQFKDTLCIRRIFVESRLSLTAFMQT